MFDVVYQAEDAALFGALIFAGNGAEDSYVDYQNPLGDFIEWTIDVPTAGNYELSWRYANGKSNRPLNLAVNDIVIDDLGFNGTGNWNIWEFTTQVVFLQAGTNKIRLTANGSSGANFDYLRVTETTATIPINVTISDALATEGTENFLAFDINLSAPSTEEISLDLAATDITAKGGLISDFTIDLEGVPVDYANQELEVSSDGNTWQTAANGTQISFAPGQTNLKVRLAVNDDRADEGITAETMSLSVASILSGTVDQTLDTGTGLIIDNDGSAGFDAVYQAEDASLFGALVFAGNGAEGSYVDYQNASGDFIEWIVDAPTPGNYELSWRYANGKSNRPLNLSVNGATVDSSLDFVGTGSWSKWGMLDQTLALQAGTNKIRLTANGSSGANFDYLRVTETTATVPINVTIFNALATEGNDLVFDVSLSTTSTEEITLDLAATDITAKGGLISDFTIDLEGDPVDYANQELEVSSDGNTWQNAIGGTQISFAPGQTNLKVRLAVNDDRADEGITAETMSLRVAGVLSGTVDRTLDTGTGSIIDNDGRGGAAGTPISTLPFTEVRVEGDLILDFDGADGGLTDKDGEGIGFTMADPTSNPGNPNPMLGVVGYWSEKLDVVNGDLRLETTSGLQYTNSNSLDNALGVGLNVPSQLVKLETGLKNLPTPVGGSAQAGLWFGKADGGGNGSSEDDYIKLVVRSPKNGDYLLEAFMEKDGIRVKKEEIDLPENANVDLSLFIDPVNERVTAQYSVAGATQTLTTFDDIPSEWFSFDQAGINPEIATRSFGGIFASHRNASSSQIFTFDRFSVTEDELPAPPQPKPSADLGDLAFDRWSIPVNNATDMSFGPDGKLYVATLFGDIHAIAFDPINRTVISDEVISTIKTDEGGNRLTLGIAVDPDSTADNVVLWVGHSDGSVYDGDLNSGKISRLSGAGFTQKEDVITGLPRAIANHGTNNIEFGPDGKLYIYQGGNTGAGSANNASSEFGDRPEQPLSAALLVADIPQWKADPAGFNGDVASPIGEFIDQFYARKERELGRPFTEVQVYASGLRNTYDGVFHSNGKIYAPDNGLGVTGTVPPVPRLGDRDDRSATTLFGNSIDNPGLQFDPLNLIVEGGYYGHPNPYRDEVAFKDGSFQGLAPEPNYQGHLDLLGKKLSANGIAEYTADNFFGRLQGDLLITSFSSGDDIMRVELSPDGTSVVQKSTLEDGFSDPLPIEISEDGTVFVGEFNGGEITVLTPKGVWRNDLPTAPESVLDAGSAVVDGKLYAIGGKTASGHVNSMYIYDPGDPLISSDDLWTVGNDLPGAAVENPAVVALDGLIYAFGGSTDPFSGAVDNSAVFNPDTGVWTAIAPMPTARGGATARVVNGDIYVIGGLDANGASVDKVEIYNRDTDSWSSGLSLSTRRDNPGSAVIDNLLYVFGGRTRNADGSVEEATLNSMEIFNPFLGTWSSGPSLITGRRTFAVGTIDDKIQVIGGEGGNVFNQNEEYNPLTNQWRELPSIPTARHGAAFGTIDDVIYVAGGGDFAGSSFTNVVEAFDA